ncbi:MULTISPECIES: NAD(P)/FAD-dependent oxidoreductase [Prochlorococcus]|uniref:NAD(P)/FAD-dependent oxidoreductase n=1 Tax=Prochlorococcus TaxID=1218 RepID=UPI00053374E9|nr:MULTISPECIES: FAD-dependent oxidoreductase [Prochlorococcus]KGG13299.1 NADH dehydrogenase [Prochlorococcus sp. MIT 0601]
MAEDFQNSGPVVVIGGGFAGLTTVLSLSRSRPSTPIVLIEPRNRFVFVPLLYELLSEELQLWEIAPFYRILLAGKGIVLVEDFVERIDINTRQVFTSSCEVIDYGQLVIATGSTPDFYGISGVKQNALSFNQVKDVQKLKDVIFKLNNLSQDNKSLVIVGAGATGVELACKIADLVQEGITVNLIEVGARVLPKGQSFNQEQVERVLNKKGIKLFLNTSVEAVTSNSVHIKNISEEGSDISLIPHAGLIWTAGVKPLVPLGIPSECFCDSKVLIDSYLKVNSLDNVFAVGDISCDLENPCIPSAQLAMQHGELASQNLVAFLEGRPLKPFVFNDRGEMLSLGIGDATITGLGLTMSGSLAFKLRRMAYLSKMPNLSLSIRSAGAWLLPFNGKKSF